MYSPCTAALRLLSPVLRTHIIIPLYAIYPCGFATKTGIRQIFYALCIFVELVMTVQGAACQNNTLKLKNYARTHAHMTYTCV